ncbi:hypothetical protein J0895_25075 [Phormidium pseudopriestleyi FRX01]|uniref:KGK family protein n=1 Tax=Phormidium pseudopriestleyi FRX01 TaxID=1759528 RepID=A0ABS3FYU8_9CYAN|nr:KGK domain-containing protein [Phormidium pseudopriestleyi]MBO0352296.1 hypothetical protein [Phormidium pseudopriestleyi FRX01]
MTRESIIEYSNSRDLALPSHVILEALPPSAHRRYDNNKNLWGLPEMSNQFEPLEPDEVLVLKNDYCKILIGQPTVRTKELTERAIFLLRRNDSVIYKDGWDKNQARWVTEGVEAKTLRYGAKNWQAGKVRMRIIVEFCPDEPEVEEIAVPHEAESPSEPESPLDEIRRMIDEPNS